MKTKRLFALLLVLLCILPGCSAVAKAPATLSAILSDTKPGLTKAQQWWAEDMEQCAPCWDKFKAVDLPDHPWFRVYKLPGNVFALYEYRQSELVISYLIPGKESALLWDTGLGIGDIRALAEALTDLPITVLNSHKHPDHIGGNAQFDRVMCYDIDSAIDTLTQGYPHDEELIDFIYPEGILGPPDDFSADTYFIPGKAPTATVKDGQIIDLGNRKLEVMYTPGHDESSITLIDEQNGLLFTGDTWYPGQLYAYFDDSSMSDYLESMHKIDKVIEDRNIRWVYGSHNAILPGTEPVLKTTEFFEDVLKGQVDYTMEGDIRIYEMDELISLYLPSE